MGDLLIEPGDSGFKAFILEKIGIICPLQGEIAHALGDDVDHPAFIFEAVQEIISFDLSSLGLDEVGLDQDPTTAHLSLAKSQSQILLGI